MRTFRLSFNGLKLKSYEFKKYKSKKETITVNINIFGKNKPSQNVQLKFKAWRWNFLCKRFSIWARKHFAPDEYAKRLSSLRKDGLKINIFDQKLKTWHERFTCDGKYKRLIPKTMEWNGEK